MSHQKVKEILYDTDNKTSFDPFRNPPDRLRSGTIGGASADEPAAGRHAVWSECSVNKVKRGKKVRAVSVGVGILAFLLAFGAGAVSKFAIQPGWAKEYSVKWSDELGTL